MKKYDAILVDVSNLYYRSYSTSTHLVIETSEGTLVTGGIYTFLKMVQRIQKTYLKESGVFYFLFDNTQSVESRRKQIDPDYKANRYKKEPQFYRGLDFLNLILSSYEDNWFVTRRPGSEADDLVDAAINYHGLQGQDILLVSGDQDWARAMCDTTDWLTSKVENKHTVDLLHNKDSFKEHWGFYPSRESICLYKSFRGDSSDNIVPGVERIPEKVLLPIIEKYKNLPDLFRRMPEAEEIPPQWKEAIREKKARLVINWSLVDFEPISEEEFSSHTIRTKFERNTLGKLYHVLGFQAHKLDPRFQSQETPLKEENFFDFEDYGRA